MAMLRRGIGVGAAVHRPGTNSTTTSSATANPNDPKSISNNTGTSSGGGGGGGEEFSRKLTEQRLSDISQAVELLEDGIRRFVQEHKDEIKQNSFLREKVQVLADNCNVDLGAAISDTPRLKPGTLGSFLSDTLLGGVENSAAMRQFYSFLSSRVVAFCMRERVLRGPVIPLALVLKEMRKRYPLEDITVNDIVKSIESLAPLNPNIFVLQQEIGSLATSPSPQPSSSNTSANNNEHEQQELKRAANLFIGFKPLQISASLLLASDTASAMSNKQQQQQAAGLSGSDALRIIVLANDIAKVRKRERDRSTVAASSPGVRLALGPGFTTSSSAAAAVAASAANKSQQAPPMIDAVGITEGEQPGTMYVRLTANDVLKHLKMGGASTAWTEKRARLALRAAREMHDDGWFDAIDRSTWLLVQLQF